LKSVSKLLRLAGSVALLAFLAWRTDWRRMADAFAGLRAGWWLLAVAVYAVTQVVSSVRWRLLARPLGFREPPGRFVAYYYVGMFFNLVLPTSVGGDVVRAWYLDGRSGRKVAAFLSVLADRASGLLVLIAIACVAAVCSPLDLPPRARWSVYGVGASAGLGLVVLLGLARYSPSRLAASAPRALTPALAGRSGLNGLRKLLAAARDLHDALLPRPRVLLITTLLSVFVQIANVLLVWLVGRSLALDVPASYYWVMVPVVTLLTLVPVSLNGMGVREWGTVLMLAPLGVSSEAATALAFLWFLTFSAVSVAGGGFYLFGRFPRFEVRPDDEPVGGDPDQGRERQPPAAA
jgi:glycosyltransferase 2 family protein